MNPTPKVSIVTPSYNQGEFIEETIRSVIGQTYRNIEYVVIDGGSSDQTTSILERYSPRLASWVSEPDSGFAEALEKGFRRCSGEILAYLNSDDLLAPDAVAEAVRLLLTRQDAVMVYGNRICIDRSSRLLYVRPSLPFLAGSPFAHIVIGQESCFWRRDAYDQVGGIRRDFRFAVDYDLFCRLARAGTIVHSGRIWGLFRKHAGSKTMTSYRTLGRAEVARVQQEIWGRRLLAVEKAPVLAACRLYALVWGGILELFRVPPDISTLRAASIRERLALSFPAYHWITRASTRFRRRGSSD